MDEQSLYAEILGLGPAWSVDSVTLDASAGEVEVSVSSTDEGTLPCPECGCSSKRHDMRKRRWRHLDTCQFKTFVVAEIPRVRCSEHGVRQVRVPWGEPGSRFTALFECTVIDWLGEASTSAVARQMRLSWDQVDGIMQRAVARGLERRRLRGLRRLAVDEVSARRGHRYLTIVTDHDTGCVVHVGFGRKKGALGCFFKGLTVAQRRAIRVVTMDMWAAYIAATRSSIPDADSKIVFDKFHVAKHLGDAVDKVRRAENRELVAAGDRSLVGTKWMLARRLSTMSLKHVHSFVQLQRQARQVARAWVHKEVAMRLWAPRPRDSVEADWRSWCESAARSRLAPIVKAQRMVRSHLFGIVNAVQHQISNGLAEGINSRIQTVKRMARGFRDTERFRNAILFHLGGLDLHPAL